MQGNLKRKPVRGCKMISKKMFSFLNLKSNKVLVKGTEWLQTP